MTKHFALGALTGAVLVCVVFWLAPVLALALCMLGRGPG